jgi:cytochrome oxidase Cu insertion factor (SCO1/SenC/PrrC family)
MMTRAIFGVLIGALASLQASSPPAMAHEGHEHASEAAATPAPSPDHQRARDYFTDLPVVTQDGQELRFYTDVLKDKVLMVNLFYTSCQSACPMVTSKMAAVQDLLGDELGRTIHFVSITVDPETDTPAVIKEYAENFNSGDGWLFLTGEKENLSTIVRRLGQPGDDFEAHPPFLLIADTRRAYWRKLLPNIEEEPLAAALRKLAGGT